MSNVTSSTAMTFWYFLVTWSILITLLPPFRAGKVVSHNPQNFHLYNLKTLANDMLLLVHYQMALLPHLYAMLHRLRIPQVFPQLLQNRITLNLKQGHSSH